MTMCFGRFGAAAALATLLLVSPGAGANAAEPIAQASEPPWSGVVRVTLVSAIERSKRFYGQVFGYTVSFDGDITTASAQVLLSLGPRDKARFVRQTSAGRRESHPHDVTITREAPNYHL